ncbi:MULTISPECIES: ROK family protein [unclassified Archaeoglobus]|jgi:predicted NBD/HSP70 family sugar kinase|uniref:ROK family protein n=1 Tax=unclassified Archaeoglobus TaxID=2643606 RepID=UPI0025BE859A|nr:MULTISPECIES: ROK family protein [unclassified Archaeoglobus]
MILGIDVGGTNTDVALMMDDGFDVRTFRTAEILAGFSEFIEKYWPDVSVVGIGIAAWLKLTPDGLQFINAPNLPEIPDLTLSKPFVVDNDANCFAYFASKTLGYSNLLGVTVGTGIGGGVITEGKIYRGCGAAGEIGHTYVGGEKVCICGGRGHLEAYFGGWAIENAEKKIESGEIYECDGFKLFCMSLANAVMILNPEAVAVGGRIGGRLDSSLIQENVEKWVHSAIEVEIHTVRDDYAVAKGAAMLARDTILQTQS